MVAEDLRALSGRTEALIEALGRPVARRFPLTYSKILLAVLAQEGPPVTAFELMRNLRVDYDDVAAVVRIARRQGWITANPDPKDRRRKLLALSAKGHALAARVAAIYKEHSNG